MQEGAMEQAGTSHSGLLHGGYLVSLPQTQLDPKSDGKQQMKAFL